jgi:3-deoxy-D-manno-octulosonic-acid transferase
VIFFYKTMLNLLVVAGSPFIALMLIFSKKRRKTFLYRSGIHALVKGVYPLPHHRKPIWIHALSVGEVLSATPMVRALKKKFPDTPLIFSATTYTGYQIATARFQPSVKAVFYFPFDVTFSVRRIAAAADPGLVIIVETDLWPNFLYEMKRQEIPTLLINARMSAKSFRGYRWLRFFMTSVLGNFSHICTQSEEDLEKFLELGVSVKNATVTGNIKFDQTRGSKYPPDIADLKQRLAIEHGRPVLLAGSTHEGEEGMLQDVFLRLKEDFSDLFLIIVPRNPDRAASVCQIFRSAGWGTDMMGVINDGAPRKHRDVIVIDRIGVLKDMYALADISFIGGSLVNAGGHNPLEPAAYSKPILFGPDMSDFKEIAQTLILQEAGIRVHNTGALFDAVHTLLMDRAKADSMGARAYSIFCGNRGATEKTVAVVKKFIENNETV